MIDFHSHVLPGIDDGAKNEKESLTLLRMLYDQGIDRVAATPHFYADRNTPERFFAKREAAYKRLMATLWGVSGQSGANGEAALSAENEAEGKQTSARHPERVPRIENQNSHIGDRLRAPSESAAGKLPFPRIKLGAEVLYYPGISRMEQLESFCLEGTRLLLLEMPFTRWSDSTVREALEMQRTRNVQVMLAHIERYLAMQDKDVWRLFLENDLLLQVNADFFLSLRTRSKAIRMFERREIAFLGSDCHDPECRVPRLGEAREVLIKKLGPERLAAFERQNLRDWSERFEAKK